MVKFKDEYKKQVKAIQDADEAMQSKYDAETEEHENGHRTTCYFYADQLTDMLNKLRAWGYAPKEETAAKLGQKKFREVWEKSVRAIQAANTAMNDRYENETNHGQTQRNWDLGNLR